MSNKDSYFFNPSHFEIAKARYFRKNEDGNAIENSIEEVFKREASFTFQNDLNYLNEALRFRNEKKILPAGRPLAQAGTSTKNLGNCFVLAFEDDTKEAIAETKRLHFKIQSMGGGIGIDFSTLRPRGSFCKTTSSRSSGSVGFITDFSYQSANVSQGGNRSGASLATLQDWHPDLLDFIMFKSTHNWENIRNFASIENEDDFYTFQWNNPHAWQTFNVSVMLSDDFMHQVIEESKAPWKIYWKDVEWFLWEFENEKGPRTGKPYNKKIIVSAPDEKMAFYKASSSIPYFQAKHLKLTKGPYTLTACEWFKIIAKNAWEDGCPGIMFIDRIRQYHNGEYFNPIRCANACAEEPLPNGGICMLTSLVLPSFYKKEKGFDWEDFKQAIYIAIRGLDNLIDLTNVDEEFIDNNTRKERRIGLGTTCIAELLILENLRYGSQKALDYIENLLIFLRDTAYRTSIELAKERGTFNAYNWKGISQSLFIQSLPQDIQDDIKQYGLRNITLLTAAPVGTTGTITGYSQGIEPYFAMCFQRNSRVGVFQDGSPAFLSWLNNNKIDYSKYNYSLTELRKQYSVPDYFIEAHEVSVNEHLNIQALFSKYTDASVSKTINMPNSSTIKDVQESFLLAYKKGIKSTTIYRDGSKQQILERLDKKQSTFFPFGKAIELAKRPKMLKCDIHHTSIKGEKWTVLIGILEDRPYEVFCAQSKTFEISTKYKTGKIIKATSGLYDLDIDDFKIKNIVALLETDEHRIITRLLSASLRYGLPIKQVIDQLNKVNGTISDFSKAIMRVLKRYDEETTTELLQNFICPTCGGNNATSIGGCPQCTDCGWSKCS